LNTRRHAGTPLISTRIVGGKKTAPATVETIDKQLGIKRKTYAICVSVSKTLITIERDAKEDTYDYIDRPTHISTWQESFTNTEYDGRDQERTPTLLEFLLNLAEGVVSLEALEDMDNYYEMYMWTGDVEPETYQPIPISAKSLSPDKEIADVLACGFKRKGGIYHVYIVVELLKRPTGKRGKKSQTHTDLLPKYRSLRRRVPDFPYLEDMIISPDDVKRYRSISATNTSPAQSPPRAVKRQRRDSSVSVPPIVQTPASDILNDEASNETLRTPATLLRRSNPAIEIVESHTIDKAAEEDVKGPLTRASSRRLDDVENKENKGKP
jgi:hypothetical protein